MSAETIEHVSVEPSVNAEQKISDNPEPPTEQIKNMNLQNGTNGTSDVCKTPEPSTTICPETKAKFKETYSAFSKFGDTKSDGKLITLSQSDKWMKQAKVIDGKKITTTDTGIHFKKLKSLKVTLLEYNKFLNDLTKTKKVDLAEIQTKMANSGLPGHSGPSANQRAMSTVERLTDTSRYTGTHKLRFDESGKGKGIAGRKDVPESSGYVTGYQHKDTFGKK